jgi:hypothetical protein
MEGHAPRVRITVGSVCRLGCVGHAERARITVAVRCGLAAAWLRLGCVGHAERDPPFHYCPCAFCIARCASWGRFNCP